MAESKLVLFDDGTLDTVFRCIECGEYERFNYAYSSFESYDDFLKWCREVDHECVDYGKSK